MTKQTDITATDDLRVAAVPLDAERREGLRRWLNAEGVDGRVGVADVELVDLIDQLLSWRSAVRRSPLGPFVLDVPDDCLGDR